MTSEYRDVGISFVERINKTHAKAMESLRVSKGISHQELVKAFEDADLVPPASDSDDARFKAFRFLTPDQADHLARQWTTDGAVVSVIEPVIEDWPWVRSWSLWENGRCICVVSSRGLAQRVKRWRMSVRNPRFQREYREACPWEREQMIREVISGGAA